MYCTDLINLQCAYCLVYCSDQSSVCRLRTVLPFLVYSLQIVYCTVLISLQCAVYLRYCTDQSRVCQFVYTTALISLLCAVCIFLRLRIIFKSLLNIFYSK